MNAWSLKVGRIQKNKKCVLKNETNIEIVQVTTKYDMKRYQKVTKQYYVDVLFYFLFFQVEKKKEKSNRANFVLTKSHNIITIHDINRVYIFLVNFTLSG